jgi:hypothetical protein
VWADIGVLDCAKSVTACAITGDGLSRERSGAARIARI